MQEEEERIPACMQQGRLQVFNISPELDVKKLERAINAVLPADVAVSGLHKTDDDFHARFSAKARRYEYSIASSRAVIGRDFLLVRLSSR